MTSSRVSARVVGTSRTSIRSPRRRSSLGRSSTGSSRSRPALRASSERSRTWSSESCRASGTYRCGTTPAWSSRRSPTGSTPTSGRGWPGTSRWLATPGADRASARRLGSHSVAVERLRHIPGFNIDRVAAAVGEDPEVLRLENLDTDIPPPESALRATREAVGEDDANSWLPFTGKVDLRRAVAGQVKARSGVPYDPDAQVVITCGEGDAMLDSLFVVTDPGDEVIL